MNSKSLSYSVRRKVGKNSQENLAQRHPVGPWNFHERYEDGQKVISDWIEESDWSAKTRANFDRALDQLRSQPKRLWSKPNPASSLGNHTYVIRFKDVTSAQLRVFGHFFDDHQTFVMTLNGYEKDDVYYPKKYESLAQHYRAVCDENFCGATVPFEDRCNICPESATVF